MKAIHFLRNAIRPLLVGVIVATSVVSIGQVRITNGQDIDRGTTTTVQPKADQAKYPGPVLTAKEIQSEIGKLEMKRSSKATASRVSPSKFFPMINKSVTARTIKPENPSRSIIPRNFDLGNAGGGSALAPGRTDGGKGILTSPGSQAKFPGIGFTGFLPPDTSIAVGPEYIVEVVNTSIAFFRKSNGSQVFQSTMDASGFFAGTGIGATPFAFDPRVVYDKDAGRFYAIILDVNFDPDAPASSVILAVSTTSNPLDDWLVYRLDNLILNPDEDFEAYWGDYPQIGFNKDFIVVSTNMFAIDAGELFPWSHFQVINKESAFSGVQAIQFEFDDLNAFCARPARMNDPQSTPAYAVAFRGSAGGNQGVYRLYGFESVLFFPQASFVDSVVAGGVSPVNGSSASPAPLMLLDNIAGRAMDASYGDGLLATAMTDFVDALDPRAAVLWVEWSMNNFPVGGNLPTRRQAGLASEPGRFHAYQPAIEINANGNSSLIYTRSSVFTNPDVMVAVRKRDDALGSFGPSKVMASSNVYVGAGLPFPGRWGDYAGIAVDPNDDSIFWGCNEIGLDSLFGLETLWDTVIVTWDIPAGNTGNNQIPIEVTPIYGTLAGGNAASFGAVDNDMYTLDSQLIAGRGNYAAYEAVYQSPDTKANTSRIDFSVEIQVSGEPAAGYLYVYNVTTSRWDLLRTVRVGNSLTTAGLRIDKGGQNYTDNDGKIRVRALAFQAVKRRGAVPLPFSFSTDKGTLTINAPN